MDSQHSLLSAAMQTGLPGARRFLVLFLPHWSTDYLKRRDNQLKAPLVLVRAANMGELLWAAEEAIACRAVAAVVADIGSHSKLLDFTASRRLSLRAATTGGSIFLLRYGQGREASAAHLRWRLMPVHSARARYDAKAPGPLRWRAELEKGALIRNQTEFVLGWTENGFTTLPAQRRHANRHAGRAALPRAVPAALADGLSQTA